MAGPSPVPFFEAVSAYQKTEAIRAALVLDLFSAIAETKGSAAEVAARCAASVRGVRILCDFLATNGFLTKTDGRYALSPDTAPFLDFVGNQNSKSWASYGQTTIDIVVSRVGR